MIESSSGKKSRLSKGWGFTSRPAMINAYHQPSKGCATAGTNPLRYYHGLVILLTLATLTPAYAGYPGWKHSGSIYLLTTPEGADLPASTIIEGFPLLVRLHSDFFDFSQAKPNGDDLRFSSNTGQPLAYQIEEWDASRGIGNFWVRIPVIKGNSRQEIKLYWGNIDAASESNGKNVFSESNDYLSVWHMNEPVKDEAGTLTSTDIGTRWTTGIIGQARHFPGQKGIFGGNKIPNYPEGASQHTSEAWIRPERPNTTILGWGNEGGGRGSKVRMQFRSPPHIHIDSDFADVDGNFRLGLGEWVQVVHTYNHKDGRIYVNGNLDNTARPLLNIRSPARMWIGGWYDNYDYVGDIDEVRISKIARSAEWIRLQYENQKPMQSLVGPLVQPGNAFSVSKKQIVVEEGRYDTITAEAGGAQKVYWVVKRDGRETIVATDRFSFTLKPGRVVGDQSFTLRFRAIYGDRVREENIPVTVRENVPDPSFAIEAPATWDGRKTIEVVPRMNNQTEIEAKDAGRLTYSWKVSGLATHHEAESKKLILKRAQKSGTMIVRLAISNGGMPVVQSKSIQVEEPSNDVWEERKPAKTEAPQENQFYARNDKNEGTLIYNGSLTHASDSVFLKLYSDGKLVSTVSQKPVDDRSYAFSIKLVPGLIKYKVELGAMNGNNESVLRTVSNLVCGDAYLIDGQSNAEATDVGPVDPTFTSDWIRSYGSTQDQSGEAKSDGWRNAVVRDRNGGKAQIGYWGMELAKRLVERQKVPICIINGAVGGSRIDQHQRNASNPIDVETIYGRLLSRVRNAGLTHGIRGIFWHQGENDQGADSPSGGYGWETYQQYFIDLAGAWKEDYPNVRHYYVFQIWPKACAMGINGSDNRLREVQRNLPVFFSNLSVMSTLGIQPPGGCHFPVEGYAEFARLIGPLVERDLYGSVFRESITAPNLERAYFADANQEEIVLRFDQPVKWEQSLVSQFYLDDLRGQVRLGSVSDNELRLKLRSSSKARRITYIDSRSWSQDNLLIGRNGIAALTFCDVPIQP